MVKEVRQRVEQITLEEGGGLRQRHEQQRSRMLESASRLSLTDPAAIPSRDELRAQMSRAKLRSEGLSREDRDSGG